MAYLFHEQKNKKLQHHMDDENFSDYRKLVGIRNGINLFEHGRESKINSECPIYVHEYSKIPSYNVVNKNFVNMGVVARKNECVKSVHYQHPKKMLNRIEETFWATWKPNKCKNKDVQTEKPKTPHKSQCRLEKIERNDKDNTPYGDAAGELIQYFNKPNFSSTGSGTEDKEVRNQFKTISLSKPAVKITPFPAVGNDDPVEKSPETIHEPPPVKTVVSVDTIKSLSAEKLSHISLVRKDESDINNEVKLFKHTDSFVINEKKKLEPKEIHFQQPKCIKLYKKSPGNNYIKGGSYPLKVSKKKEPTMRNFRLGPPGQLIVTGSSYNKNVR